ncbi:MAG: acyl-CoA thioesterase [Alphaproteobacteria bacterium]
MAESTLFSLTGTHNTHRYYLPVEERVTVGPPGKTFLFGGVGLASSIEAMERTCGRPAIWATAQYLSYARPGEIVDLDVTVPVHGNYNSQARVIGHVEDREIFTVNAALGARPSGLSDQWSPMPDAPAPEDCPPMRQWQSDQDDLNAQLDIRVAKGRFGPEREQGGRSPDGETVLWARTRAGHPCTSAALAIIADFVPSAAGHALGRNAGANSLDNTLRIRRLVPTDWVLCRTQIQGIHGGFIHGSMLLFAQDGDLMAVASQSGILRVFEDPK